MIKESIATFKVTIKAALRGGLIASGVNVSWLFTLEYWLQITGLPKGFPLAVVLSTFIPLLLGAVVYFVLVKNFKKGEVMFLLLGSGFTILSLFPSFALFLPNGEPVPLNFVLLTVPMHFFAAAIGMFYIINKR